MFIIKENVLFDLIPEDDPMLAVL